MTRGRVLAPVMATGLFFAACSGPNENTAVDPDLSRAIEDQFPDPLATEPEPTVATAPPTTPATTAPAEPWEGDADAAIATIEEHLFSTHADANYAASIVEVAIDPATGRATVTTTLPAAAIDTPTYALAACEDAAMVAFAPPANLTGLDVADSAGTIVASANSDGLCV